MNIISFWPFIIVALGAGVVIGFNIKKFIETPTLQQLNQIKDAIAQAQQAKQTADTALETAKQDLETLKGEKTVAQQALAQAQQTQQDIDSQIARI